MDLDVVLLVVLQGLLLLNWPVAYVLTRAALRPPHIWALTIMASATLAIAIVDTAYLAAVFNSAAGSPIDQGVMRVLLRTASVGLGLIPLLFLWVYLTGRFGDGEHS